MLEGANKDGRPAEAGDPFIHQRTEPSDRPRHLHSVTEGDDVEEHAGLRVAVDAVDGCHGSPNTLLRGTDDDGDHVILLHRPPCRNLCCCTLLLI